MIRRSVSRAAAWPCMVAWICCANAAAAGLPAMLHDFRNDTCGWVAAHEVEELRATPDGLSFVCTGSDPYIWGPPESTLPTGVGLLLTLRMKSTGDANGQIFYGPSFRAGKQVNFLIEPDGEWHDYSLVLPPLEQGSRLRIDPSTQAAEVTLSWITVLPTDAFIQPAVFVPPRVSVAESAHRLQSGEVTVVHGRHHWNDFVVRVGEREMAAAHGSECIGTLLHGEEVYLPLGRGSLSSTMHDDGSLATSMVLTDREGAHWTLSRRFDPTLQSDAVSVTTTIRVDQDREVFHLPLMTLVPGLGTFGERKQQAVLPGVEYLADEPSSSEADLRGPRANRRLVEPFRITLPMMALVADDRYIGMAWDREAAPAPVFDTPDRLYQSGGHLMGLWYPSVGVHRMEGDTRIARPLTLKAGSPVTFTAMLFGGRGETVGPAVRHAISLAGGLPPVPTVTGGLPAAVKLLAHGWLDSELNVGWRWRHAVWQDRFGPAAVADAPGYMLWLAEHTDDSLLAKRLQEGAARGLEQLVPKEMYEASCSHVARPFAPLLFGSVDAYAARRLAGARQSLARFDEAGLVRYHPKPGGPDYASTHWTDHANGLSAAPLESILEAAAFTGDPALTQDALNVLDAQCRAYEHTVPRGAQTWEMPLHTPDILAAARLLRCCTLAYQLTGDSRYIERGRAWAWTGVSLVYLDPPTVGPVGLYSTIAVLGSTNWQAPCWIGLPVQWCGLVYRSALQDFAGIDPKEGTFWAHLAKGITRSGLQQTFPLGDTSRQGLLPDFYHLKAQRPDGPAISPGTLQAHLAEAYDAIPIYSLRRVTPDGMLLHVPGAIGEVQAEGDRVEIQVTGWSSKPYWIRLVRIGERGTGARFQGGSILARHHDPDHRTLTLQIEGSGTLVLDR